MNSILKKAIENNKAMYIKILWTGFIVSFLINLLFTIYPEGINRNSDKKYYKNEQIQKSHEQTHACHETYSAIMSKLSSTFVMYCVLLFSIIHLFLQTNNNEAAFITFACTTLMIVSLIGVLIGKIIIHKKHILVFKKDETAMFLNIISWFSQILLAITIFLFNNKLFNLDVFNENNIGNYMYIVYFVCSLIVATIFGLNYSLFKVLDNNVTDENLCNFYS